ncbi:MAG: hypothetical protein ACO1QR_08780 [Chthoniobacteraceae bacterium]
MASDVESASLLRRIRIALVVFIIGLVLSGVTAFPLLWELSIIGRLLGVDPSEPALYGDGLRFWIALVWRGLQDTYADYPFIAYGTDWLAFAHLMIALFFLPVYRDPQRYRANLLCGIAACVLVVPLALICGPIRDIPLYWRLIDCSFGVVGIIPLLYALRLTDRLPPFRVARGQ